MECIPVKPAKEQANIIINMENNSILQKLDGLEARFEEVSTLITDPDVIADQNRFVKLTNQEDWKK